MASGPNCAKEKLVARWAALLGSGDPDDTSLCPMYIFGDWISLVAPHIRDSEVVQTATACLLDSAVAYVTSSEQNINVARKSNAAALRTIRIAIQAGDAAVPRNDILIAIKLLGVVEVRLQLNQGSRRQGHNEDEHQEIRAERSKRWLVANQVSCKQLFLGAHTQNYRYHAAGLVDMLQRMCRHGRQYDEISQ
jgi:hypothetical protein